MHPVVTKYYVRRGRYTDREVWYAFTYHPRKGETRPPDNRKPFMACSSLPKIMDKLKNRQRINQAH